MPVVRLRTFGGMRPGRAADLLAPGEATFANNTKLSGGDLESFKGLSPVITLSSVGTVRSIHRFGQNTGSETQFWFESTADADFVIGPVLNDTEEKTYYTGIGGYPRKTKADIATVTPPYPTNSYKMGIPQPVAPTVSVSGSPSDPNSAAESVTYVITYVSAWGEEGGPSPATPVVSWRTGQTVTLSSLPGPPVGNYNITSKRIYRSAAGTTSTKFQFLTELAVSTPTYNDTTLTANLGETLTTAGWDEPPDSMIGLVSMANGMLAGFTGNTVCFSEPFAPYAWPARYQQSVDAPIVGIGAFDQSLFVGTRTGIYVFSGTDPATMSNTKLPVAQSCVSKRSIVEMDGGVVFASPDGLFYINGNGLKNLTEGLMTRTEWQAYKPDSIDGYESDNRYIGFFDNGSRQGGMVFTFGSEPSMVETDLYATAGFRDKTRDALYLVTGSTSLGKWDAGAPLTQTWQSGVFRLANETNMAAARVEAETYPCTFKFYADGVLKHTQTVMNRFAFRLPGGYRATRFHFEISAIYRIRSIEFATSMSELARE